MDVVKTNTKDRVESKITVTVRGAEGSQFAIEPNDMLLKAALEQDIDYPHNCRVGVCGQCKTRLLSGRVSPMVDLALSPLSNDEILAGYFLACQGKVRSDIEVEVTLGRHHVIPEQQVSGQIIQWRRLPGDVVEVRLQLHAPFFYEAGQYGFLSASGSFVRRCFSFADAPPGDPGVGAEHVSFLIKRLPGGAFSEWLFAEDRRGTKMWLHGPYGVMGVDDKDIDGLCVAGGTGLAPVLSIVQQRLAGSAVAKFTLIFGVRTAADLFAMDTLAALSSRYPGRLTVIPVLSHEPDDSSWSGARGLVTAPLTDQLPVDYDRVAGFICGSLPMVEAVEQRLLALGVAPARIHADKFLPSG